MSHQYHDLASKDFHFKEFEVLRKEIESQVEHTRKLEIYAVAAFAAFYAWFLSEPHQTKIFLCIPIAIALLGSLRSAASLVRICEIAAYLKRIEKEYALKHHGLQGWECFREFIEEQRRGSKNKLERWLGSPFLGIGAAFWIVLVLVSLAALALPVRRAGQMSPVWTSIAIPGGARLTPREDTGPTGGDASFGISEH
jgi:hypothetical protein